MTKIIVYRCRRCNWQKEVAEGEKPPTYCERCALTHVYGRVDAVSERLAP